LLALASLPATLVGARAHAQDGIPCTAISNDAERLACYDRALRVVPPATTTVNRPLPPAPAAAPPPQAVAAPPAPPPAAAPQTVAASPPAAEPPTVQLVIVGVRALPGRGATFTTDDGQVWVQTDSVRVTYPPVPFAAELKPGAMGSSFLVPKDRRAVRVRQQRD
jgi:hypothetical protein